MAQVVESVKDISEDNLVITDLEGTLTPGNRDIPEDAGQKEMLEILEENKAFEGNSEVGYWSGIHLLAGEHPDEYFSRVEKWKSGEISYELFERENIDLWNNLVDNLEFSTAEAFLDWYNEKFLNLRKRSRELAEMWRQRDFKIAIISHTSTSLSLTAAEKLGVKYVFPTWKFNFNEGYFKNPEMEKYAEDKSLLIPELRDNGVEEIVFYGNAQNDVEIANKSDRAFMVENKASVDYNSVDAFTGTFDEVLEETENELQGGDE